MFQLIARHLLHTLNIIVVESFTTPHHYCPMSVQPLPALTVTTLLQKSPNVKLLLNETRFLNDFFEKRVSSFGKALQGQVFPIIHFGEDISKLQKRNSKMCEVPKHVSAFGCKQSDSEL